VPGRFAVKRSVALLRGLNVGGHTVRMAELREAFEDLGFEDVATFIASGNVIFRSGEADAGDAAALERRIEAGLRKELGYDVATFIRSCDELTRVAAGDPFPDTTRDTAGAALHVAFMREPVPAPVREAVLALRRDTDDFRVEGREVYWLVAGGRMSDSPVGVAFARLLGSDSTMRNMNTVRRMVVRFCERDS
jgi:uncharacterized protein (DUF1697 family)